MQSETVGNTDAIVVDMDFPPHSVMFELINDGIEKELITGEDAAETREMMDKLHNISEDIHKQDEEMN